MNHPFHSYIVYAWHFAKCPGMSERKNHSHTLVSYDREWLLKMHQRIAGGAFRNISTKELVPNELEQIELEAQTACLTQKRKSLEWDVEFKRKTLEG